MSGTASIGSFVNDHTPTAAAASVSSTTRKRCSIENFRTRSSMSQPPRALMTVSGAGLSEFGLEDEGAGHDDLLTRLEARRDRDEPADRLARLDGARGEHVRLAFNWDEDGGRSLDRLNRALRYRQHGVAFALIPGAADLGPCEHARLQAVAAGGGDLDAHGHRARRGVNRMADERHRSVDGLVGCGGD